MSKLKDAIERLRKEEALELSKTYAEIDSSKKQFVTRGKAIKDELNVSNHNPRIQELKKMKQALLAESEEYYDRKLSEQNIIRNKYIERYNNLIKFTDEDVEGVDLLKISSGSYNIQMLKDIVFSKSETELEALFEGLVMDNENIQPFAIMKMYASMRAESIENVTNRLVIVMASSLSRIGSITKRAHALTSEITIATYMTISRQRFMSDIYSYDPWTDKHNI